MPRNAAIVRRGYEAFDSGDHRRRLTELFGENASWHTPGRSPLAGDIVGRDAVRGPVSAATAVETGGTFKADLKQRAHRRGRPRDRSSTTTVAERERQATGRRLLHRLRDRGRPHR